MLQTAALLKGDDGARKRTRDHHQVMRADGNHDRANARHGNIHYALIVPTASPGARGATHASFIWFRIAAGRWISSFPSNFARAAIELMLVKFVAHILLAKLDRVHANLVSEFIEQRLHCE